MRTPSILSSTLLLAAAARGPAAADVTADTKVSAIAPAETIVAGAPAWCDGVKVPDGRAPRSLKLASELFGGYQYDSLRDLVWFSCTEPNDKGRQAIVQAVRQSISNDYGLTGADNIRLMKLAASLHGGGTPYKDPDPKDDPGCKQLAPSTAGPNHQRLSRALERVSIGCGDSTTESRVVPRWFGTEGPAYWVVDFEGGFTSQLARAGFLNDVLKDFRQASDTQRKDLRAYTPWVSAQGITLDDAEFRTELQAMKLPEASAMKAIIAFRMAMARYAAHERFLKAAATADKSLQPILFSGPAAARAAWAKDLSSTKATLESVLELERKRGDKPGGMTGCAASLYPTFQGWLRGVVKQAPAVAVQDVTMSDNAGSLIAYGLSLCSLNDEQAPVLDKVMAYYFFRSPHLRGPIMASFSGMMQAMVDAENARKELPLSAMPRGLVSPPSLGMSVHTEDTPYDPTLVSTGIVKGIKKSGDDVELTFSVEKRVVPVLECGETSKVWYRTPNGTAIHTYACKQTGTKTVTGAPRPIKVPAYAAAGIKAGGLLRYTQYTNGAKADRGWPIEAFSDKAGKKRVNMLGVPL